MKHDEEKHPKKFVSMMKNRQVEVNLSPRRGEDTHVEETIFGG
jgi:hypothetical protein